MADPTFTTHPAWQAAPAAGWQAPPRIPGEGEVHLWLVELDPDRGPLERLWRGLDREERIRANGLRPREVRRRYVVCRSVLRELLALYLDRPAAGLRFDRDREGKPRLAGPRGLSFNLARRGGLALVALAAGLETGVALVPAAEEEGAAGDLFSRAELERLHSHPLAEQPRVRALLLARKKAYVKARGAAGAVRMNRFTVYPEEPPAPALLASDREPAETERWLLAPLPALTGMAGALVTERGCRRLDYYRWNGGREG